MSIRFTQSCPTCGRRIQVQATLLGHSVACPHCQAEFTANGDQPAVPHSDSGQPAAAPATDSLMARVERALAKADAAQTVA